MGHTLIAIDPGSKTGWAIYENHHLFLSGEKPLKVAVQEIKENIDGKRVDAFAIENMYFGAGRASPSALYKLGHNTGYIVGLLEPYLNNDTVMWNPQPGEWRKVLEFARGSREEMAALALEKAETIAAQKLEGPRGGKHIDRAMAICIGRAMTLILKGDFKNEEPRKRKTKTRKKQKKTSVPKAVKS